MRFLWPYKDSMPYFLPQHLFSRRWFKPTNLYHVALPVMSLILFICIIAGRNGFNKRQCQATVQPKNHSRQESVLESIRFTYIKPKLKKIAPSLQSPLPRFSRERIIHTIAKCLQLLMLWSSFIIGLLAFCQLVDVFCTPILPICGPVLSLRNFYFRRQWERWKLASYRGTLLTISWYSSISNLYWLSR